MKRRQFLRTLGGASAAVAAMAMDNPFKPGFRIARADHPTFTGGKTLVCVYLRGGIDGINIVVPHGYDPDTGYYAPDFRPTIAIPKPDYIPGSDAALDLGTSLDTAGLGLGLHPNMTAMHQMYMNGNLAVMPAVHYPSASRSHFSGQYYTESARVNLETDGWLQRYLADSAVDASDGAMRAAGFSSDLPQSLHGDSEIVSVFNDLRSFELGISNAASEAAVLNGLTAAYNQSADPNRLYAGILHDFGRVTINDLAIIRRLNTDHSPALDPDLYVTASGTSDYTGSTFARQMKQTALLIKAEVGLEAACLSRGGFDTHSNQGVVDGSQGRSIGDVSDNLGAFFDDLNADGFMDNVIVLLMSEFGRTSFENGSFGTDHAHATIQFVAGTNNTINGGVYLGHANPGGVTGSNPDPEDPDSAINDWINYDPLNVANMLNNGRYLNHTINYQNVFGEILSGFLNANYGAGSPNLGTLLPEFAYADANKVGFLT